MRFGAAILDRMQARLRRVRLKRRIAFTVALYLLAVAVMAVAGGEVAVLVRRNRVEVAAQHQRQQTLVAMRHSIEMMETLGNAYLRGGDTLLPARLNEELRAFERRLESVMPDAEALDGEPLRLSLSVNGFIEAFDRAAVINGRLSEVYWVDFATPMKRASARLEPFLRTPGEAGRLALWADAEMQRARMAVQARQATFDGGGQDAAREALRRVADRLSSSPHGGAALAEAATDMAAAIRALNHLESLYRQRRQAGEEHLALYGRAMLNSVDRLTMGAAQREAEAQDALERRLMVTLEWTAGGALLLLLLGLMANGLIARSIREPILRLNAAMRDVSEGNWGREIDADEGGDEIAEMSATLAGFKRNALRLRELEIEKREILAREKEETERALRRLDQAHHEIQMLNERLNEENLRLGAELDVSRRLQHMLLPRPEELAAIDDLEIAAFMEAATEVGGDYYDVLSDADGVCIGIGDVTGHGLESGVVMLMAQSAVRTLVTAEEHDLSRLLDVLNRTMFQNIRRMGCEKNLSFALLAYRPRRSLPDGLLGGDVAGRVALVGQHESILILRRDGGLEEVDTLMLGLPLGLVDRIAEYTALAAVDLRPGDLVVLYSDGMTEAVSASGELFGLERLKAEVSRHVGATAEEVKDGVLAAVRAHVAGAPVYDDMTLLVIRQK